MPLGVGWKGGGLCEGVLLLGGGLGNPGRGEGRLLTVGRMKTRVGEEGSGVRSEELSDGAGLSAGWGTQGAGHRALRILCWGRAQGAARAGRVFRGVLPQGI